MDFVADRIIRGKAYPALARHQAEPYTSEWRQFAHHWPNTVPVELFEHAQTHAIDISLTTDIVPGYYAIGLGWFNFDIDYFELLPQDILRAVKNNQIKILFYYHEGDNPYNIKNHLDVLARKNSIKTDSFYFVSGNTQADSIPGFSWFPDHELLYWHRNREIAATATHLHPRPYQFTILNRTHKWWRATAMADLWRNGLLNKSMYSYRTDVDCGDRPEDNPIEIDSISGLRRDVSDFLAGAPYTCDHLTVDEQNDHHLHVPEHYTNSYCSIIFETHFDADGSGGAFLTEKTFKCIKHGHPFIIVGAPGSLNALRKLGYRTFDHALDSSYDWINNNTQRWNAIRDIVTDLSQQNMHDWFQSVIKDVKHNQQLFLKGKQDRVNNLLSKLKDSL